MWKRRFISLDDLLYIVYINVFEDVCRLRNQSPCRQQQNFIIANVTVIIQ